MPTIKAGSTDVTLNRIRALDSNGAPVDAAYDDAGISLWYRRGATGTKTAITPASQTAGGAHTDGGFVAIDDGWCRLDLPDAAVAAGVTDVIVGGTADDWELVTAPLTLVPWDPQATYLEVDTVQVEGGDATDAINAAADTAISDAALATSAALATVDGVVDTLAARLTAARAGYLDNLSAGAVATAAKLLAYVKSLARSDYDEDGDIGGTYDAAAHSLQAIRGRGDSYWGVGSGAIAFTYTVTDSGTGNPIDGVFVKVTTDAAGNNPVASGYTDADGEVVFYLDAGTRYFWSEKAGYDFTNPDQETVS